MLSSADSHVTIPLAPESLRALDPATIPVSDRAYPLGLDDLLPLLVSPDSGEPLSVVHGDLWTPSKIRYRITESLPLLFPNVLQRFATSTRLELPERSGEPVIEYVRLGLAKQYTDTPNSPHNDPWYMRHVFRARQLVHEARGTVLDVGCDSPRIGAALFPTGTSYAGLDVLYADKSEFRVIGLAEFLPFGNSTLDNVAFLTSLDHVLDYHRALNEANRVLRPGGRLFLANLVWNGRADLMSDLIHFHHFREYEILGALSEFSIEVLRRYPWKGDTHRSVWYISAIKP